MDKNIIIDGVDVAGCRHLKNDGIKKPICRSGGCIGAYNSCLCKDNIDCDYKQLKRLEQECDELKKTVENQKLEYEELQCDLSEVENACGCYQSENAKLKQENKGLKELNKKICEDWEKEIKVYWNAFEEIRELVKADCKGCTAECDCDEDCTRYMIKNKINEVLE